MAKNVFDVFQFGCNESNNVRNSYEHPGERYDVLAPQLMPVYSLSVDNIYYWVESVFWVKVLGILISITKGVKEKDDFKGYSVLEDFLKSVVQLYLTTGNHNIGKFDLQKYFKHIDNTNLNKLYVVPFLEDLIVKMENDKMKILKKKRKESD